MTHDDFISVSVPSSSRQGALSIFLVWIGFIIVVGTMAVGGGLVGILLGFFTGWLIIVAGYFFSKKVS